MGKEKCFPDEKVFSYWDKASILIFMWVMQRETYGCILYVFKSTFHFWLMITSNARVSYSFLQPLLFS